MKNFKLMVSGLFKRRGDFEHTIRGYGEHVPERIRKGKDLFSFVSHVRKYYDTCDEAERIVYLIADAEIVITSEGFAKYFTDTQKIQRLPDLINALKAINEPHTLSVINDFINLVKNRDLPFNAESVELYIKEHLYIARDWNEKFLKHRDQRWNRIGEYLNAEDQSAHQDEPPILH
ncbi:MAG TPA: hypothetical protein PKK43_13575 [Spirochaetota bacterium]|nr:hypothetical protein [Spirochaetota bacterium]